jgi:hypothetical protein
MDEMGVVAGWMVYGRPVTRSHVKYVEAGFLQVWVARMNDSSKAM